ACRTVILCLAFTPVAWAQNASDYQQLIRGYVDAFRVIGRAKACRVELDPAPFFREVARRHGENSEPMRVAQLAFAAGAGEQRLPRELEPVLPAPMPCDVVPYMKGMRLPDLPAS